MAPSRLLKSWATPPARLAEAFQPLRLVHLALQPLPFRPGPQPLAVGLQFQPFGDVADGGGDEDAFGGADGGQGDLGGERAAVPAPPGQLHPGAHRPRPRIGQVPGPVPRVHVAHALRHQQLDRLPTSSSRPYPNSRSAWAFTSAIRPSAATHIIASGAASSRPPNPGSGS